MPKSGQEIVQNCHAANSCRELLIALTTSLADAGIEESRLEAQLLICDAFGASRAAVIAGIVDVQGPVKREALAAMVVSRVSRQPLAYIRGFKEFYGLRFRVSPYTLIPRPDTELIVDYVRNIYAGPGYSQSPLLLDVGTGTGCIPVSSLVHCSRLRAVGVDISAEALQIAIANARDHGVQERVRWLRSDLLEAFTGMADIIVSNLPYIPKSEIPMLAPEVRAHEPILALDGGDDGLVLYRRLIPAALRVLKAGGHVAFECGVGQAQSLIRMLQYGEFDDVDCLKDLAGIDRVVIARRATGSAI